MWGLVLSWSNFTCRRSFLVISCFLHWIAATISINSLAYLQNVIIQDALYIRPDTQHDLFAVNRAFWCAFRWLTWIYPTFSSFKIFIIDLFFTTINYFSQERLFILFTKEIATYYHTVFFIFLTQFMRYSLSSFWIFPIARSRLKIACWHTSSVLPSFCCVYDELVSSRAWRLTDVIL